MVHAKEILVWVVGVPFKIWKRKKEINGYKSFTTNNIMELMAVIEALKTVRDPSN